MPSPVLEKLQSARHSLGSRRRSLVDSALLLLLAPAPSALADGPSRGSANPLVAASPEVSPRRAGGGRAEKLRFEQEELGGEERRAMLELASELACVKRFPCVLALGLYKEMGTGGELGLAQQAMVVHGVHQLMWADVQMNEVTFLPVYRFLLLEVMIRPSLTAQLSVHILYSLIQVLFQFCFHYEDALAQELNVGLKDEHGQQIQALRLEKTDGNRLEIDIPHLLWSLSNSIKHRFEREFNTGPVFQSLIARDSAFGDLFVNECVEIVKVMDNETSIMLYIQNFSRFQRWNLSHITRNKLQILLFRFAQPGAPGYNPRTIRLASRTSHDQLFPNGRRTRAAVNMLFRALQPKYIPASFYHWAKNFFNSLFSRVTQPIL